MRILTIILLVFLSLTASAQKRQINGVLKTADGNPVAHASVTLKNAQNRIVAFKSSDAKGLFALAFADTIKLPTLTIEINHLGYKKVSQSLTEGKTSYEILMEVQPIDLAEIEVKSRPKIDSKGDTLAYDVASFAKAEDRTIGDVLSRMPGMEVSEGGQIKYNGQNISNFYIDGDDLLDDKYSIGTKTIPHAMVQKLEVLQNHQPLKVLQNKTLSENVAINLVIKEEAKLKMTGQAKIGAGLPHQYDSELNTILFNKKYKMLNVLKGNNVGTDLNADFTSFNLSNMLSSAGNTRPSQLLSSGTAGDPALPKKRYYFNDSGSLNANNLVNLANGLQLKSNINLLLDRNDMLYNSYSELYLGGDTIRYNERQQIDKNPFLTELTLSAQSNKTGYFFNNALKLNYRGETGSSSLLSNDMDFGQQLRNRIRDFSNTLEYVPELKNKNIISVNWYLNHYNQPQTLNITPGINEDTLNNGVPFAAINQTAQTPTWFSRASVSYRIPKGKINQSYRVGVLNEFQHLQSDLLINQHNGQQMDYAGSEDNDLRWTRHQAFVDASYERKAGRWENVLNIPVTAQRIAYRDPGFDLDEQDVRVLVNPTFRSKFMTTTEDYLTFNYGYSNRMGNINGVYRGVILTNYRSLRANDAILAEEYGHNAGLRYNFQRSISMLFINGGINYSKTTANTIPASVVTDNIVRTILLPFENDRSSFSANAGISKFIFALGATASLKASWSTTRSDQFQNGQRLPFNNISFVLNPGIEARLWNKISMTYNGTGTWTTSRLVSSEASAFVQDRQIQLYDQTVGLTYSPVKNGYIRVNARHQYNSQELGPDVSYLFADANIRYKVNKWRTDLELDLINLTNIRSFETYSLSANSFGYSHYQLRERMAVLKATFNL